MREAHQGNFEFAEDQSLKAALLDLAVPRLYEVYVDKVAGMIMVEGVVEQVYDGDVLVRVVDTNEMQRWKLRAWHTALVSGTVVYVHGMGKTAALTNLMLNAVMARQGLELAKHRE